jgi:CHASE3 domain sensor protein
MDRYFVFADEAVRLAMENRNAEAYRYMRTAALPANNKFREDLAAMKAFMHDLVRAQTERSEAASRASVRALATCLAAAAALGLMMSFLPIAAKR